MTAVSGRVAWPTVAELAAAWNEALGTHCKHNTEIVSDCQRCDDERFGCEWERWQHQIQSVASTLYENRYRLELWKSVAPGEGLDAMFENVARSALLAAGIHPPKPPSTTSGEVGP